MFAKKTILFIGGFILIILVIHLLVFISVRLINVGEFGVLNKINEGKINSQVLISGSSRAYKSIDPTVIKKITGKDSYNIATVGSTMEVQIAKLKWYLKNNNKPEILIQDVAQTGGKIKNLIYEPFKYLPYILDDSLYSGLLKIDSDFWKHKYLFPMNLTLFNFDFYFLLGNELVKSTLGKEHLKFGYYPDNSVWSTNMDLLKKKIPNGINAKISKEFKLYMNKLISICNKNKIKLVLVTIPNYYRLLEIVSDNSNVLSYYRSLENNYNVFYLDLSEIDISRDTENYYNFSHLNDSGAKKFSEILANKLQEIIE